MKNSQLYLWKQSFATVPLHNAGEAVLRHCQSPLYR
jgi:hypothetical protein